MRRARLAFAASLLLAAAAGAAPPDEDALPDGAFARLGSRVRRWRPVLDFAVIDEGRTLLLVHPGPLLYERDLASGQLRRVRRLGDAPTDAAHLAADGRILAIERRGLLELWDVPAGRRLRVLIVNPADPLGKEPAIVRLTPDGATVLIAAGARLIAHDVRTGQQRLVFAAGAPLHTLEPILGGRCVLCGDPEQVRCLDLASGQTQWLRKGRFDRDQTRVLPGGRLAWLPLRTAALSSGLYDLDTGWPAVEQPSIDSEKWKCASAEARIACVREAESYVLRDLISGRLIAEPADLREPLAFLPDGQSLLGRDAGFCLQRWDARSGRKLYGELATPAHLDVTLLGFQPATGALVSGSEDGGLFRRWDPATRRPRTLLRLSESTFLHTYALLPDGRRLLHKGKSPDLELWDLDEAKQLMTIDAPRPFGYQRMQMQIGPDGRTLYALFPIWEGGLTFGMQAWDIRTGELRNERAEPTLGGCLAFSADASLFASAMSGTHDTASGRLRAGLPIDGLTIQRLTFSPDLSRLAAVIAPTFAGQGGIVLSETATGRLIHRLAAPASGPVAFSPDGRRLVSASADALQVWDAWTGRELRCWPIADVDHSRPVATVLALSPDGGTLASGHADGTILLWHMPPRERESPLSAPQCEKLWRDLAAADAGVAWSAAARLANAPANALALFRERLGPMSLPTDWQVRALIHDLDAASYMRREAASRGLAEILDLVEPQLRSALLQPGPTETRRRLRALQDQPRAILSAEGTRRWRAIAILQQIGTPEATAILKRIAEGPEESAEARTAQAALRRLQEPLPIRQPW